MIGIQGIPMALAMGAKKPPLFRSSSVADGDAETVTLSKPTGTASGDMLVAAVFTRSDITITPPTGFTQRMLNTHADGSFGIYTKMAGGSEPASYDFDLDAYERFTAIMLAYQNAPALDVAGTDTIDKENTTTIIADSITSTGLGTLIGFFAVRSGGESVSSGPSGMTLRAATAGADLTMWAYDLQPSAAGATGSKTLTIGNIQDDKYGVLLQLI